MNLPPSKKNSISTPYRPRSFPPRNLNKKRFAKLLQQANCLAKEYHDFLLRSPSPQRLFFQIINLESVASIQSQKVKTTFEEFLRFLQTGSAKNSKMNLVRNYKESLEWACKNIQKVPISKKLICTIHKKAKQETILKRDLGAYRNRQNWIGPAGCKMEEAYFFPPAENKVESLMKELLDYIKRDEREPLLQLALFFAQLLIIHPFMDGNGRIARILIPLFLYQKEIISIPFFFMSSYFLLHRLQYFQNLFKTTEQHRWESWIVFFLKGMNIEMKKNLKFFKKILALYQDMRKNLPLIKKETLLFLFENPILYKSSFIKSKGTEYSFKSLVRLKLIKRGTKNLYYFSPFLKILKDV